VVGWFISPLYRAAGGHSSNRARRGARESSGRAVSLPRAGQRIGEVALVELAGHRPGGRPPRRNAASRVELVVVSVADRASLHRQRQPDHHPLVLGLGSAADHRPRTPRSSTGGGHHLALAAWVASVACSDPRRLRGQGGAGAGFHSQALRARKCALDPARAAAAARRGSSPASGQKKGREEERSPPGGACCRGSAGRPAPTRAVCHLDDRPGLHSRAITRGVDREGVIKAIFPGGGDWEGG